ncbi:MAG: nickel pincer cofactor biosynthesis protein LarC [Bacteroidales bacterium]|nr:nickel pincer cofactor biosynthesis protein LarC [Bacteroidales bacterium]
MSNSNMVIYYNCFSGISGDMNLAAMIDLGVPAKHLKAELKKLDLDGYDLNITRDSRNGIFGTRVDVLLTKHEHHHRHLKDIYGIIESSTLPEKTKNISKQIFHKIAVAEGKIHEMPIEKVHFHEVGAIDSIVDIVGAAICYNYLKPKRVYCDTIELGSGTVKSEHGIIPVPAPATLEILENIPTHIGGAEFETTTPTGAAILATIVDEFTNSVNLTNQVTGYGVGHKISETPNLLRVFRGEIQESTNSSFQKEDAWLIECNIDDMNPEWYELIMEKLFLAGAQDVFLTNIIMKKSRPGIKLSVLCAQTKLDELENILLTESTSLGLRVFPVQKTILERKAYILQTKFGEVRIKSTYLNGEIIRQKPEYDDCKKLSLETGESITQIMREIDASIWKESNND